MKKNYDSLVDGCEKPLINWVKTIFSIAALLGSASLFILPVFIIGFILSWFLFFY